VIAVAALTGSRLAGWQGVAASVGGLMLPSIVITLFMTAALTSVRDLRWVKAALHGIVVAAAGGSVMVGYRLIRPILEASRRESLWILAAGVAIVAVAALLALLGQIPLLAVLISAGAVSALVATMSHQGSAEVSE
jgi:chromate transport protein ChrA